MRDPKFIPDATRYTLKQGLQSVEIFRTNVKSEAEAERIQSLLKHAFPFLKINFDLDDSDHILRVAGERISPQDISALLRSLGLECELLN